MASTIQLKTGTGSAVPSSLTQGEVAINIDNGLVYYGSGSGNAVKKLDSFTHITASGTISAAKLVVTEITSSRITSSVVVTSGSNIFGDTIADTHTFNGHITGSNISASGTGSFGMLIIDQNITASNISASGTILSENITATDITVNDDLTVNDNIVLANNSRIVSSNESNTYIELQNDDGFNIRANNVEIFSIFSSGVVVNDAGQASADFRIESDSDTHAFFVDSGANKIAIGTGTVGNSLLTIDGDVTTTSITASSTVSASAIHADNLIGNSAGPTGLHVQGEITASGNISSSATGSFGMLIVDQNITASGNISSSGTLTANTLRLTSTTDASATSTDHAFQAGLTSDMNVIIDVNEVMARNNGSTADLHLNPDGGAVSFNNSVSTKVRVENGHITASGNISSSATGSFGMLIVDQNITASGNISSSGTINGSSITTPGDISTDGILFTDDIRRLTDNSTSTRIQMAGNNINIYAGNASNSVLQLVSNAGAVFNNGGVSSFDFRVEGDNDTHLLFADAGADKIAIGTGTVSDSLLTVDGDIRATHITASSNISASGNLKANYIESAKIPLIQYISDDTTSTAQGRVLAASSHNNATDSFALEWSTPLFEDTDFFETGSVSPTTTGAINTFAVKQTGRYEINCNVAFKGVSGARPGINLGIFTSSNAASTGSFRPAGPSAHAYIRVAAPAMGSTAAIPGFVIQLSSGSAISVKVDIKDDFGGIGNTLWSGSLSHFNMKKIG
jgi:hypothetical protein